SLPSRSSNIFLTSELGELRPPAVAASKSRLTAARQAPSLQAHILSINALSSATHRVIACFALSMTRAYASESSFCWSGANREPQASAASPEVAAVTQATASGGHAAVLQLSRTVVR